MGTKNKHIETNNVFTNDSPETISNKNQKAIDLLNTWIEKGDKNEQKETWEYLKKELDENRLSDRKFF